MSLRIPTMTGAAWAEIARVLDYNGILSPCNHAMARINTDPLSIHEPAGSSSPRQHNLGGAGRGLRASSRTYFVVTGTGVHMAKRRPSLLLWEMRDAHASGP